MSQSAMETSSGLIMNVIRILTNSKDDAERDKIKKNLEDLLADSDQKLTKLVLKHQEELSVVVQSFISISNNLQKSLTKLAKAKQRLVECREKLASKLEELRRLSDESKKNEKILALLDQIDDLSRIPSKISELLNDSRYLDATRLLVEKQRYVNKHFEASDFIKDIKLELEGKKEEIYRVLREKLFLNDDESLKDDIKESLYMIDKTPDLPDTEIAKEKIESQTTKPSLFKFSLSSHAICFNEHYKEQIDVTKTLMSK